MIYAADIGDLPLIQLFKEAIPSNHLLIRNIMKRATRYGYSNIVEYIIRNHLKSIAKEGLLCLFQSVAKCASRVRQCAIFNCMLNALDILYRHGKGKDRDEDEYDLNRISELISMECHQLAREGRLNHIRTLINRDKQKSITVHEHIYEACLGAIETSRKDLLNRLLLKNRDTFNPTELEVMIDHAMDASLDMLQYILEFLPIPPVLFAFCIYHSAIHTKNIDITRCLLRASPNDKEREIRNVLSICKTCNIDNPHAVEQYLRECMEL